MQRIFAVLLLMLGMFLYHSTLKKHQLFCLSATSAYVMA